MAKPREIFEDEHRQWGDNHVTFASLRRILDPIYDGLETLMAEEKDLATAQAAEATELATVTTDLATLSTDTTNALKALKERSNRAETSRPLSWKPRSPTRTTLRRD